VLLGVAIAALMVSNRALTSANGAGIEISTAEFLVEQIREMTASLPVRDPQSGAATFVMKKASFRNMTTSTTSTAKRTRLQ